MGLQQKYVEERRPYRKFIVFLKRLRFSNGRLSVYDILEVLIRELRLDSLTKRASYMAFNFTLSNVGAGGCVVAHPAEHDAMDGAVGGAVAAAVEPVAVGAPGAGR